METRRSRIFGAALLLIGLVYILGKFNSAPKLDLWYPDGEPGSLLVPGKCGGNAPFRIFMLGDSRVRQIFQALTRASFGKKILAYRHEDHLMSGLSAANAFGVMDYAWAANIPEFMRALKTESNRDNLARADLVLLDCGLHDLRTATANDSFTVSRFTWGLQNLQKNLETIDSPVYWMLQPPIREHGLPAHKRRMTNRVLKKLNLAAAAVFNHTNVQLWTKLSKSAKIEKDGIHLDVRSLHLAVSAIFNFLCQGDASHLS